MRPVYKAVAVASAAALSVTACGTTTPTVPSKTTTPTVAATATAADPTPGATANVKTTAPVTAENPLGFNWATLAPFTGPAVDKFGAASVMSAYRHAVEFSLMQGYTDLMAKGYDVKPSGFTFVDPYLSASAQKLWATQVLAALTNHKDTKAPYNVASLTTWDIFSGQDSYTFRKGQVKYVDGTYTFSPGTASLATVAGQEQLVLRFTVGRTLRAMEGGKAVLLPLNRDVSYQMVPNGLVDRPWLIDSWHAKWALGKATPDPQGTTG